MSRSQIVFLSKEGLSQSQITAGLWARFLRGHKWEQSSSERPKVTPPSEDQYIRLVSLRARKASSSQILLLLLYSFLKRKIYALFKSVKECKKKTVFSSQRMNNTSQGVKQDPMLEVEIPECHSGITDESMP